MIVRISLAEARLRDDGRANALITVELSSGAQEDLIAILQRAPDGALQVCGDTPWLQFEDDPACKWLASGGVDPCELAAVIDQQAWGRFPQRGD